MNSREREKVPFDKSMLPQGNVEIWLGEVERRMRNSVRQQVVLAMAAYANTPRKQWVREWPAMVVLAVSAIYWSREVEEAIEGKRSGPLGAYVVVVQLPSGQCNGAVQLQVAVPLLLAPACQPCPRRAPCLWQ